MLGPDSGRLGQRFTDPCYSKTRSGWAWSYDFYVEQDFHGFKHWVALPLFLPLVNRAPDGTPGTPGVVCGR